jgi:hypothetical protein
MKSKMTTVTRGGVAEKPLPFLVLACGRFHRLPFLTANEVEKVDSSTSQVSLLTCRDNDLE